jgi:hypothetical protein
MTVLRPAGVAEAAEKAPRPELSGRVTIPEIAAWRGVSVYVIRFDRANHKGFPGPAGTRPVPRGRPMLEYRARDVKDFYRSKEQASPQARRGVRHRPGRWSPGRRVDDLTIAQRLGLSYHTVRSYPAVYAGTSNPFPPKFYSVLLEYRARHGDKPVTSNAIGRLAETLAPYSAAVTTGDDRTAYAVQLLIAEPAGPETTRTWRELSEILCQEAGTVVTKATIDAGLPQRDVTHAEATRDGMRRWGDIETWSARRPGSGRHEQRTPEQKDAARRLAVRDPATGARVRKQRVGSDRQGRNRAAADT